MIVSRYNIASNTIDIMNQPFKVDYGTEELLFVFDQSSTCTALTIGTKEGKIRELITFERENRKGETVSIFLSKITTWIKTILSNCNVVCYSIEQTILTRYKRSDDVTKQVRGVLLNIYQTSQCINKEGQPVPLIVNALVEEINNKEWKAMIIPKEHMKAYRNEKEAIHMFVAKIIPAVARMAQDIADSICMYLFLVKTKYGNQKLKANKSSINWNHNLVALAFPFDGISRAHPPLVQLGDGTNKLNKEQLEYINNYKLGVVKKYLSILQNKEYDDEYTNSNKQNIEIRLGQFLKLKNKDEINQMVKEANFFPLTDDKIQFREFEFNDKLTLEENLRCFTCRDNNIYYSVIPKNLHYCYIIPMFELTLGMSSQILVVATRY